MHYLAELKKGEIDKEPIIKNQAIILSLSVLKFYA